MFGKFPILRVAALGAVLAATAAPSAADAAAVSIKGKCYVAYPGAFDYAAFSEPIPVEIDDATPGREVRLTLEVKGVMTSSSPLLTVSKNGSLTTSLDSWITGIDDGPTRASDARMVLRDFWLGTELGSTSLQVANVGFMVDGGVVNITTRRHWFVSGLSEITNRNVYYAHYFVKGRQTTSMYLGKTQDRCGFLKATKLSYPGPPSKVPKDFEARIQTSSKFRKDEPYIPQRFVEVGSMPAQGDS